MRVKVWGCRGSLPVTDKDVQRYGGNTSCVEVRSDDTLIVLDAGSGIRSLGLSLKDRMPKSVHLILTHLHLDHIIGLPFFAPLWEDHIDLHVWGPPSPFRSFEEQLIRYISPPLFPLHIGDAPPSLTIHDSPVGEWEIGRFTLTAEFVRHQGPTMGYRVSEGSRALAYIPDHEPARGLGLDDVDPEWLSGSSLSNEVDVLIHDAQYSSSEYQNRVGWGHSSIPQAIRYAELARARQLLLFHHDPNHSDRQLEELLSAAREIPTKDLDVQLARESMEFDL